MKHTFIVTGMHCKSCGILVKEALEDEGASSVITSVDEKKNVGTVTAESSLSAAKLKSIIESQGAYKVK